MPIGAIDGSFIVVTELIFMAKRERKRIHLCCMLDYVCCTQYIRNDVALSMGLLLHALGVGRE
jgi:hypothetical protein